MKNCIYLIFLFFLTLPATAQQQLTGRASFYSNKLNGRKTASGEYYLADSMTCAHKKLPFGTRLRVYNPRNGKEVVVRVTDRGPYRNGFILDLSYAAAKELDIIRSGHAMVEVTVLPHNLPPLKPDQTELPHMETAYTPMVDMRNHKWQKDSTTVKQDSIILSEKAHQQPQKITKEHSKEL